MFRLLSTSAIGLISAVAPAFAEVTPAQVWDSISQSYRNYGYTVTEGAREEAGDTLTLTDVALTIHAPVAPAASEPGMAGMDGMSGMDGMTGMAAEGGAQPAPAASDMTLTIPKVVLQQTGDGNVRTVFEGDITGKMGLPEGGEGPNLIDLTLAMPGNEMITSGTPEAMAHAVTYPEMTANLRMTETRPEGAPVVMPLTLTMTDTKGSYKTDGAPGAAQQTTYDLTSAAATLVLEFTAPEGSDAGTMKLDGKAADLTMTGLMKMPAGTFDLGAQMNEALKAGLDMSGTVGFGAYDFAMSFSGKSAEGAPQTGNATAGGEGGDVTFLLGAGGVGYKGSSKATKVDMTLSDLPFPVGYAIAGGTFDLMFPVMASDQPAPFKVAYTLNGLTLADQIWGMFDPTAQLPRDPADLEIDVAGDMKVVRDLFDPTISARIAAASTPPEGQTDLTDAQKAELEALRAEAVPFEPVRLAVNRIHLKAVGAEVDASGELSVPEGGTIDAPVGTLKGNFKGVNALIDRLVALGFVPQDQVAATRMMLMAFAKPVEGQEDTLETTLEFKEGGSVFANGQQVK